MLELMEKRLIQELTSSIQENEQLTGLVDKLQKNFNDTNKELGIVGSFLADICVALQGKVEIPRWLSNVHNMMKCQLVFDDPQNPDNSFIEEFYKKRNEKIHVAELEVWREFLYNLRKVKIPPKKKLEELQ